MSAFVVIGLVILVVVAQVTRIAVAGDRPPAESARVEQGWQPTYDLQDRAGRLLARFTSVYELEFSPRSLWQAHTPDRIATVLSEALGGAPSPAELLPVLLPDAEAGVIQVRAWNLTRMEAERLAVWIDRGGAAADEEIAPPLRGFSIRTVELTEAELRDGAPGGAPRPGTRLVRRLFWIPELVLSAEERALHDYPANRPVRWSRHLSRGLYTCLEERLSPEVAKLTLKRPRASESELVADVVWSGLMPCAFRRLPFEVAPEAERAITDMLAEEGISDMQMHIATNRQRKYPLGEYEWVGDWGYRDERDRERHPRGGLEALGNAVMDTLADATLRDGTRYEYFANRPGGRSRARRAYFLGAEESAAAPIVRTTLDHGLQRVLRASLEDVQAAHQAVLAMGIVVDVESGDVLAVDGVHGYDLPGFLPTYFQFTPGSTFKLVTMATALEAGVVRPGDEFNVGYGPYSIPGSSRTIHEAEGTENGVLTAADCIAFSSNRGMVQLGLLIPEDVFWGRMKALGYGRAPVTGLGPASPGYIKTPHWKPAWDQASFCFGHQILTTLWQHAAALTTIVRGGVYRPLQLVHEIERDGEVLPWPSEPGERVFSARTCAEVRAMMELGARVGTGRSLFREDLRMGTKTGTAEKVGAELCGHREMQTILEWGRAPTSVERRALARKGPLHGGNGGSCYTSSICVFGSRAEEAGASGDVDDAGHGREVLVLIVVEEPVRNGKYGSKVAGPTAMRVLDEALGITHEGRDPKAPILGAFAAAVPPQNTPVAAGTRDELDASREGTWTEQPWQARLGEDLR